jgi:hypothetical protein
MIYVISDEPLTPEAMRGAVARMRLALDSRPGWPKITSSDARDDPEELRKLLNGTAEVKCEA